MSWRIADTGEVIDISYSQNRPKRLKTTINDDDSITIAPNTTNESLPKGWKLADESLQTPKGWKLAGEPKPSANYSNLPNSSNSLTTPKGWRLAEPPQMASTQTTPSYNTQNQNPFINDPLQNAVFDKGEKPMPQMGEFDKTKSYTPNDFFWDVAKGVDRGYMKIGAGINKALGKASKKLGANKTADWFEDNYYRNQHLINKDNAEIKNKYAGLGGEIASDPTIMLPLGILGKTRGFKNTVKSGLAGAAIATPTGVLKDYGDESISNKQMMSNTLINALAGGGINSLLASKTGNVLVNKIANAYRGARGKERVAYSNFRRGVEVPQAPEQTNSQVFENIKNVYDDIGIDTPLPKVNITPYNEALAKNQAQNSEFIKGDGFRMQRDNKPPFTDYNVKTGVDEWVKNLSELEKNELEANLYTLYKKHPELYQGPADVYRDLIQIKNNPTYFFKNNRPDISLLSKKLNDGNLGKLGVVKDSGYVGHVSRSSKYQKEMDRLRLSNEKQLEVGAPYPTLPRTDINQAELTAGAKAHSQAVNRNILPSQNLKAPITTDDIFKEAISLHKSGFKFGKDINENINLVLNKIKNDRLNATNNTQMPNNELLPQPKAPEHNPNWYDEFVKNKPANMDMNYLKKYYDVDGFLNDRANVLAKDIRYNNRQIEPSKIVDNQGHGGWEYKRTRQITEPNYNADFQITKADVNAIKNGTATNQTIQKLADDLEASKHLGYGYDNFSKNVDNYLTSLEKRGVKPELISSLRQKLANEPELFTPQRIKETEEFIKNNPNLVLKTPKNEPISKKLTDDTTYDFKSENIFTDLRKNKIGDLNRHPKVFEALKNLDEANARAEFKLKNFNNETFLQEKARLNADFLSKDDVKKILQNEIEFRISNLEAIDKFYNMHPKALNKKELLKMADELENINKDLDDILNVNIVKPILNSAKRKLDQNVYDIKITDNPIQKNKYRQILENRLNITPIKEFGKNYAEFYHNPNGAINKLLAEKKGQVAGAFYRKDLGDIDLVWGDTKIGLRKILDKHIDDFKNFSGNTPLEKISNALDEIIKNGKMVNKNGVITVWHKKGDEYYKLGISQGFNNSGENKWVITSYEATREKDKTFGDVLFTDKRPLTNSSNNIISKNTNNTNMKGGFTTQAMVKNIVSSGIGGGIGAYSAPEDKKLEGFIIGALGGMGASNFGGISHSAVNLVKNMIKTPKGIDKAIEKGVDKGLVGVANKFLSKEAAKTWSDIGGNVANIKYLFANTLDKSYEKVRDSVTGELNAMFNKYVNLSSVLNQLSKKDNKAFYDFLANNGSIENLSPEIRKFANDVRNQIIKEFEYQVGAKLVDENTALTQRN